MDQTPAASSGSTGADNITGLIDRVTIFNEETGVCVLRVKAGGHRARLSGLHYLDMRPDIIVEGGGGHYLFSAETDKGREWLAARAVTANCQRLGKSLSVDDEDDARDLVDAAVADGLDVME